MIRDRHARARALHASRRIHLQAVVDMCGNFAFGRLYTSKRPETAADVIHEWVVPFYKEQGPPMEAILTDNRTVYKGHPMVHLYQIFLELAFYFGRGRKDLNLLPACAPSIIYRRIIQTYSI